MPEAHAMSEAATDSAQGRPYRRIEVKRACGALGAEIAGVDLSQPLDAETFGEVYRAWLENHVVFIRGQDISPDEQLAFAKRFGDIHIHPFNKPLDSHREILEILKTEDQTRNNGGRWHSDQMYTAKPAKATMLFAREMPPYGGDTQFTNLHLAYEGLSDGMKKMLSKLKGVNNGDSRKNPTGMTRMERERAGVGTLKQVVPPPDVQTLSVHPIVRTHPETGRKVLYIGSHTERFDGMTDEESEPLLQFLMDWSHQPQFTFRLRWEVGTLTLWDNRCTQHFAINDYTGFRRRVHKITVCGDVPY